ncbi:hypothetical protein B0T26DRAFT_707942 [Lasiosphaeria miniovina]|uniref:Uncharacterized protein n=1 Tax=Lasiosphaeria miniovina TaxID=1954250 RepID=A0AA40AJE0_9PEZI|nr:uncharacterized protein B0T26DRAFT_707942 [Lasiosphaeria miniovina]KAK0716981.1 hypothetical protein B0T26DRAFT_707942 [Lasiosphaeria miniovina]
MLPFSAALTPPSGGDHPFQGHPGSGYMPPRFEPRWRTSQPTSLDSKLQKGRTEQEKDVGAQTTA